MDIAGFLTARLDEDEAVERANRERAKAFARTIKEVTARMGADTPPPPELPKSRRLAEIAAKRTIVEDYHIVLANNAIEKANDGDEVRAAARDLIAKSLLMVLRRLAAPYADHPDFKPEWRME